MELGPPVDLARLTDCVAYGDLWSGASQVPGDHASQIPDCGLKNMHFAGCSNENNLIGILFHIFLILEISW